MKLSSLPLVAPSVGHIQKTLTGLMEAARCYQVGEYVEDEQDSDGNDDVDASHQTPRCNISCKI